MITEFPHSAPEGYTYEQTQFNTRFIAIWLRHHFPYSYKQGSTVRTIWGFYSLKKKEYYAPINATKPGAAVKIQDTTPYTAMPLTLTPLERCFV